MIAEFIKNNLSPKSSDYILKGFNTSNIESKMRPFDDKNTYVFHLGQLNQDEYELYLIMESLMLRINGTRKRIDDTDEENEDVRLTKEREDRLSELSSDWSKIRNHLYERLEERFKEIIKEVSDKNTDLLKNRSSGVCYMGYKFVFYTNKNLGITNYYPMGGD